MYIMYDNQMQYDVIVVGAGASGLMAARELSRAGKKVLVLEARERIGGRIFPLNESKFGYPAEGGAEWVHDEAPITKQLVAEAGLTLILEDGDIWDVCSGEFVRSNSFILDHPQLKERLASLAEDMSVADFLQKFFSTDEDALFRNSILKMAEGYESADPARLSIFAVRDEWLTQKSKTELVDDHRIKEGYGALLHFLQKQAIAAGTTFVFNAIVQKVEEIESGVMVHTGDGKQYNAKQVILTVPLPILKEIELPQELSWKQELAFDIGFGNIIKVLFKFKTRWWKCVDGHDFSKMEFLLCNEPFMTWWSQYPVINNVLTGWAGGSAALRFKDSSPEEIQDSALTSLSHATRVPKETLVAALVTSDIINWPAEPFTKGAYSYTKVTTKDARTRLRESYKDMIFFAGEAVYSGHATATVEGALGSGFETAQKILEKRTITT
jgi:monoamine oxidase